MEPKIYLIIDQNPIELFVGNGTADEVEAFLKLLSRLTNNEYVVHLVWIKREFLTNGVIFLP
jgi:hypothetical protein